MADHRSIDERWVIKGKLYLETPAHLGNGEVDALTDMPLLLSEVDQKPLLLGTSIAGALRNYLREVEIGFGEEHPDYDDGDAKKAEAKLYSSILFGGSRYDDEGGQSPLIVHDALGTPAGTELRDGVAIDAATRTADDGKKFDIQLLSAGSSFDLQFELLISKNDNKDDLLKALATTLKGLEVGEIALGARKRRGYGQCKAKNWEMQQYNLHKKDDLLAWLSSERDAWRSAPDTKSQKGDDIKALLDSELLEDKREFIRLKATFGIDGTLLIRSGFGDADTGPDTVHMHARHKSGSAVPIIPGTSWAGVLRHRALKIASTITDDENSAQEFVDDLFGPSVIKEKADVKASRISFKETEIKKAKALVITRVKIDRFTGGAYEGALFSEQPAIGTEETEVTLDLHLRNPKEADAGLILLLLKDLWTGDLPIGGESGVGRGRLKGKSATLSGKFGTWQFTDDREKVVVTPETNKLEEYVKAFNQAMNHRGAA